MDNDESLDEFSDYSADRARVIEEREQRHTELTETIHQQEQHDFLLSVEQSEVYYTIDPRAMPWRHIQMVDFIAKLSEHYRVKLDTSAIEVRMGTLEQEQ